MYRIIVIDDEKLVIKSLIATVDWEKYGFEIIGEAYNGQDGFELIKEKKPDLVFVDIRMPGKSGLELISDVNELGFGTLFAVVSGYAEFAYAQKAIKNGAISYCLKPFSESELVECLRIATEKLEMQSQIYKTNLLMLLEEPWEKNKTNISKVLERLKLDRDLENGLCIAVVIEKDNVKPEYPNYISRMRLGRNKQALFIASGRMNEFLLKYVPSFYDRYVSIGISAEVRDAQDLKNAIDDASSTAWNYFITGKTSVVFRTGDIVYDEAEKLLTSIEKYNYNNDHEKLLEALGKINEAADSGMMLPYQIVRLYNHLKERLPTVEFEENDDDYINNIEQLSYIYINAREMIDDFKLAVEQKANRSQVKVDKIKNITAKQILEYVNENFSDDIAIRQISQIFFINPSYLSQLFKKEVGETFTKYLMKLRIQYSCELLVNTSLNISEIAEKSGYADYFYFARVFKKATGYTPSQYRGENA